MPNLVRWLSIYVWEESQTVQRGRRKLEGRSVSFEQLSTERFVVPFLYVIQSKATTKFQKHFL